MVTPQRPPDAADTADTVDTAGGVDGAAVGTAATAWKSLGMRGWWDDSRRKSSPDHSRVDLAERQISAIDAMYHECIVDQQSAGLGNCWSKVD